MVMRKEKKNLFILYDLESILMNEDKEWKTGSTTNRFQISNDVLYHNTSDTMTVKKFVTDMELILQVLRSDQTASDYTAKIAYHKFCSLNMHVGKVKALLAIQFAGLFGLVPASYCFWGHVCKSKTNGTYLFFNKYYQDKEPGEFISENQANDLFETTVQNFQNIS